jgi:hypothetical protein
MAVVGEAHVLVKAITTGFDKDLRRQLQGMTGAVSSSGRAAGESLGSAFNRGFNRSAGNVFTKVAEGIATMVPEADAARVAFRSMVRTGYTLGTALTSVIGGVSALIGGLITLVGAVGQAAPALFGLVTAFVQMRVAISLAQFALGGIGAAVSRATQAQGGLGDTLKRVNEQFKQLRRDAESAAMSEKRAALELEKARNNLARMQDLPPNNMARREAELALEEAELNYRQAKERSKDLNDELKKGKKGLMDAAGVDPYAGLTKSQKAFAQFLVKLNPKLKDLKEAVASGFLPVLQTQIQKLVDEYFPDLLGKFKDVGDALGQGAINIADNFLDPKTKAEVLTFFDNLTKNIPTIGSIFGEIGEILFKVFNDADGIATKFLDFVLKTLEDWNKQLDEVGLEQFFADAYETGSQLFGILGNIFNGLGDFFKILKDSGAMDTVLGYLTDITEAFAGIGENKETGKAIGDLFSGLANNFGPVMNFLGQLVTSFLKLGANPNIGKTFEILASPENAANWDTIFKAFADAGPSLATLATSLGELLAGFADSGAPKAFFDTLNSLLQPFIAFIQDPNNKAFVDTLGRIFAVVSAISLAFGGLKFAFMVLFGNIGAIFGLLGGLGTKIGAAFEFFKPGKGFDGLRLRIWYFFEGLQKFFVGIGAKVGPIFTKIATTVGGVFTRIGGAIGGFFTKIGGVILNLARTIGIGLRLAFAANPIGFIITAIMIVISALTYFFTQTEIGKQIWAGFTQFVEDSLKNIGDFFNTIFTNIAQGWEDTVKFFQSINLGNIFKGLLNGIIGAFEGLINNIIIGWNNGLLKVINSFKLDIPQWVRDAAKAVGMSLPASFSFNLPPAKTLRIPRLADGATVMPSPGGSIVNVAEAGRPERIEPLDPDGLSQRDKAIIKELSGGTNGMTINVYPSAGMDEKELADLVSRRIAFEIRKGVY